MEKLKIFFTLILAILLSSKVVAFENEGLNLAQEKMKASFSNISVVDFKETKIENLYEIDLGNGTIYYHSETEWLFFGEIWNKEGKNLTVESRMNSAKKNMERLPMETALNFGDPDGIEIIEFTDPDCPYCRSYERFYEKIKGSYKIKRKIFFDTRIHPEAVNKVIHIICSENQEDVYKKVYAGITPKEYESCDQAEGIIAKHRTVAESLGVSGTPTFILNGEIVTGFKKSKIINFLNSQK